MRLTRRETLREAVFLWNTPFCAPRISSGSATFIAVSAACLFPAANCLFHLAERTANPAYPVLVYCGTAGRNPCCLLCRLRIGHLFFLIT